MAHFQAPAKDLLPDGELPIEKRRGLRGKSRD